LEEVKVEMGSEMIGGDLRLRRARWRSHHL
jgi:hypothetical protein